jgi:hypothetical protein
MPYNRFGKKFFSSHLVVITGTDRHLQEDYHMNAVTERWLRPLEVKEITGKELQTVKIHNFGEG